MSKIFDEYAKIAEERGLISKEAYPMDKRVESRTLSDIEILYGVKPNGKDEKDIVEQAHPETAVVAPAYDKMNGIVENQNQLADVMRYIALRPPNGLYQQKRFVSAEQDLIESLVRIGFLMDNKGEEDLMKLADSCAGRLEKKSALPVAVPIIAGIVGALGLLAVLNRTDNSLQNVVNNTESVIRELNDLQGKMDVSAILGDMLFLQKLANEFDMASKSVGKQALDNVENVMNASESHSKELKVAKKYRAVLDIIGPRITNYKRYIETAPVASEYKYDWMQKIEDVGRTLFSVTTDKEDVINALGGLEKAIVQAKKEVDYLMNQAQEAKPTIEAQLAEYMKAEDAHNPSQVGV